MGNAGDGTRRRGQARDDADVLAEAQKPSVTGRGQVYPTGEIRDGREVFRVSPFCGAVMVSLIERYEETGTLVSCQACKEVVFQHSTVGTAHRNPLVPVRILESAGLVHADSGARSSDRLPRSKDILLALDDGTVLWPRPAADVPADRSDTSHALKSKKEIGDELAANEEELERLRDRARRAKLARQARDVASAAVERLRAELALAEGTLAEEDARVAEIGDPDPARILALERRSSQIRPVYDTYEDIVALLVRDR